MKDFKDTIPIVEELEKKSKLKWISGLKQYAVWFRVAWRTDHGLPATPLYYPPLEGSPSIETIWKC